MPLDVFYQVWLDGKPYLKGKRFAYQHGAWALHDRIVGRIGVRQGMNRVAVMSVDETGSRPSEPQQMSRLVQTYAGKVVL